VNTGFDPTSAITFSIGLPASEYSTRRAVASTHQAILDRLASLPDVKAASASTVLPLSSGVAWGNGLQLEGGSLDDLKRPPIAMFRAVAAGYFETMGIPVVRGHGIDRSDVERGEPIVVINQALANILLPGRDALGHRVRTASNAWLTIVGIVANTPTNALAEARPTALLYMPMSIAGGPDIPAQALVGPSVSVMSYVVRSAAVPFDLLARVRAAVGDVDRNLALARVTTLQELLDRAAAQMAFTMVLMAIAAGVSLLLGVIGIYGAMSYIVSQRTGEIGIRLALGAEPGSVARMIVWQGAVVALAGITVGLASAFAGSRLIQSLLYGVTPRDPGVFAGTTVLLLGVVLLACWLPARRAARLSPLDALRAE
jgi:putative ABC transport system permease protein